MNEIRSPLEILGGGSAVATPSEFWRSQPIPSRVSLSVVVPCYNEAKLIEEFLRRMIAACESCAGDDFEIIIVDDGSRDRTLDLIAKACRSDHRIVAVELFRNHGQQLAVTAGLQMTRGDRVLLIDADLQDPPELLGSLMAKMDEGYDVVYGRRRSRDGETWAKKFTSRLFYRGMARLTDVPIPLDTGDFRLISREVVDVLNVMPEHHRFVRGMVSWVGGRQTALVYDREPRFAGQSKFGMIKLLALALDAVTGFSIVPLRLATLLAFLSVLGAIALSIYVICSFLLFATVDGWTSLAIIILALSATQLFVIGVLGEYVGRLFVQAQGRPKVIIRRVVRGTPATETAGRHEQA